MSSTTSSVDLMESERYVAISFRHRLVIYSLLDIARDAIRLGFFTHVLEQCAAVRINQEEFENMIYRTIGFVLSNQVKMRHHIVDLFWRSGKEQPAVDVGALCLHPAQLNAYAKAQGADVNGAVVLRQS